MKVPSNKPYEEIYPATTAGKVLLVIMFVMIIIPGLVVTALMVDALTGRAILPVAALDLPRNSVLACVLGLSVLVDLGGLFYFALTIPVEIRFHRSKALVTFRALLREWTVSADDIQHIGTVAKPGSEGSITAVCLTGDTRVILRLPIQDLDKLQLALRDVGPAATDH